MKLIILINKILYFYSMRVVSIETFLILLMLGGKIFLIKC
jgi:hypothetical protein